jgi:uncharacterized protein YqgC (DUF456 family)
MAKFRKIAGISLVVLGITGCFLPFLQGILMITAGLALWGDKKQIGKLFDTLKVFVKYLPKALKKRIINQIDKLKESYGSF